MKEVHKIKEGLLESRHVVKEMSKEEIDPMVKEIELEEEKVEEEDKVREEQEEQGRNDLFNAPHNSSNALQVIKSIRKNKERVEEFRAFPNKKKQGTSTKDPNFTKRLALVAGDIIEWGQWKRGNPEDKDIQKAVMEILLVARDLEVAMEALKAVRIRRTSRTNKEGKIAGIEKQLEQVRKQLTFLAAVIEAVLLREEVEVKRLM